MTKNKDISIDELVDEEFADLFSAYDGMKASADLKAKTLDAILELTTVEIGGSTASAPVSKASSGVESARVNNLTSSVTTSSNTKAAADRKAVAKKIHSPFRVARIAAIAACMSAAIIGGVAYALPTSHMVLIQGDAAIELDVNQFGMVIAATSESDVGKAIINSTGLVHVLYSDALTRAADAMSFSAPGGLLQVRVESSNASQRELLESDAATIIASHTNEDSILNNATQSDNQTTSRQQESDSAKTNTPSFSNDLITSNGSHTTSRTNDINVSDQEKDLGRNADIIIEYEFGWPQLYNSSNENSTKDTLQTNPSDSTSTPSKSDKPKPSPQPDPESKEEPYWVDGTPDKETINPSNPSDWADSEDWPVAESDDSVEPIDDIDLVEPIDPTDQTNNENPITNDSIFLRDDELNWSDNPESTHYESIAGTSDDGSDTITDKKNDYADEDTEDNRLSWSSESMAVL